MSFPVESYRSSVLRLLDIRQPCKNQALTLSPTQQALPKHSKRLRQQLFQTMSPKFPAALLNPTRNLYTRLPQHPSLFICQQCRTRLPAPPFRPSRAFSTTLRTHKKASRGGKQESKRSPEHHAQKASGSDPLDFADYNTAIARAHQGLKDELAKIKAGGKNTEGIENVRVKLDKNSKEVVKLGEVASVILRGRNIAVLVGEKDVSIFPNCCNGSLLCIEMAYTRLPIC